MRTRDGVELIGRKAEELVSELHRLSRSPCGSDEEFRYQMAGRAKTQTGMRVRWQSAEEFIDDLVRVGLLIEDEGHEKKGDKECAC